MSNHSLRDFLRTAKKQLHDGQRNKTPVTLVMGNDKADIDTIAATLIFAYLRSLAPPSGAFSQHYIPLIQVGRNELSSVLHLTRLLPHLGLEAADLLVLDDMALDGAQSHLSVENTRLFLINWNILVGRQGENYARNIEGCIDIHRDEGYVPAQTTDLRIIGQAGSCTSLVVNALREEWQSIGGPGATDKHLASLGLGGVMVPTKNLQSATQEDEAAYRFLEGQYGNGYDRSSFYGGLIGEDSTSRQAPTYTEAAPAQAIGSDIGSISQSRTAAAPPTSTGEGDVHNTFTGNRLDPMAQETVASFHEEVLPEHVHGSTGQHLTGTLASGYSGSGSTSTGGYGNTSGTTGYESTSGASAPGYESTTTGGGYGSSTGAGYGGQSGTESITQKLASATLGSDSYGSSGRGDQYESGTTGSSSQYGNSNIDSAGLGSTLKSHGADSQGLTSGNYGTGLSGSNDDYTSSTGATGSSQRSYAPGTTSSTTTHDSENSSGGGIFSSVLAAVGLGGGSHQQSQDASHPGTSGIGGYSSGTTGGVGSSSSRYEGEGAGQTESLTGGSSAQYGSSTGGDYSSSTAGQGSSASAGYGDSYGSATGTGSSNYGSSNYGSSGTSGIAGTSSHGNTTGGSGNYSSQSGSGNYGSNVNEVPTRDGDESSYGNSGSSVQDTAKELAGNTRFGGEATGTGNGAPTTKPQGGSSGVHF